MKFNKLITFISLLFFSACTEIIQLDLNSSNPQVVIEGSVPVDGKARISLTKSVNFDNTNSFPTVSNALITLKDDLGNSENLAETVPGVYISNQMIGIVGRTYSLTVNTDGKTLSSSCKIPNLVKFDSLNVEVAERNGFRGGSTNELGTLYTVKVKFKDPANETNYYRFIEYVNRKSTGNVYVYEDRLNNGKTNEKNLFNFNRYLTKGDIVTVEMQCITQAVYEYFNSFGNLSMGPSSSTPANPFTNINGSVLGYFSAHTSEKKSVTIK
jgi:hypothetical protein